MVIFETKNLSFSYPKCESKALKDVSLKVNEGEFVLVTGKTGSGKSTLLRLLKPELAPFGDICGEIINHSEDTGFVMQNPDTSFVAEHVRGELAFAPENRKMKNDETAVKIGEISSFFNISDMLDKKLCALSGGERAVVSIAAAMICDVKVLILDEPLAQLDPKASDLILNLLRRVNEELGVTVIMSSHTCDGVIQLCDRFVIMDAGRIVLDDKAEHAKQSDIAVDFLPVYTSLFTQRPLTVKEAIPLSAKLKEKPLQACLYSDKAVVIKNVTFAYAKKDKDILSSLSLTVGKGTIHSIIGANGSGKTTLLKLIAGIKKPYSGKIKVSGSVAYMPQNPKYLFTKETVGEEINPETAKKFGLDDYLLHHPYDLSGGQCQKLALAMLSQQGFDILLLDEPSKALDVFAKRELKAYLKYLSAQGKTVIMVSHNIDFVGEVSDYVSFLSDSVITITGRRRQVLSTLNYYTTQIRRITRAYLKSAVSPEDIE